MIGCERVCRINNYSAGILRAFRFGILFSGAFQKGQSKANSRARRAINRAALEHHLFALHFPILQLSAFHLFEYS